MVFIELVLVVVGALYVLFRWATYTYKTFEERGAPYEKPLPLVGNDVNVVLNRESFLKAFMDFYRRNKRHKVVGYFNIRQPFFIVNDPECIKKITVKDFDHFPNHHPFFNTDGDPLLDGMLTIMKDQRWKDMRTTLTPIFTASKMRAMFSLMNECFDNSLTFLRDNSKGGGYELELKDLFTRLSNDIIASTAFGLKVDSYKDRNNEFYSVGQSLTVFRGKQMIKLLLSGLAPKLMSALGQKVFDAKKTQYFMNVVLDAMKYREENKIVRPDMIQLLMDAKKESEQNWTDVEVVAQCFIFFFAAFENNANFLCTTCHELMENPDIQQRLYEECMDVRTELHGAPLTYDAVSKMKYMDMVVSESLRKWPLAPFTDRVCAKDYELTDEEDNVVFKFKKGDRLWLPIAGLLDDEEYFENPRVYDPERFSDLNKDNIRPFTYIPFGVGPRNCIGNRYALMQVKAMLYYVLLDFKLERSSKTVENLMDDIRGFQVNPRSGFWMHLVKRK